MKQRAAFGEDGDVEARREPIRDRAECCERLGDVAAFGGDPGEIAGGVQFGRGALSARASTRWRVRSTTELDRNHHPLGKAAHAAG